jgi:hypothetical protein
VIIEEALLATTEVATTGGKAAWHAQDFRYGYGLGRRVPHASSLLVSTRTRSGTKSSISFDEVYMRDRCCLQQIMMPAMQQIPITSMLKDEECPRCCPTSLSETTPRRAKTTPFNKK